jgi:hypothetical protein
MSGRARRTPASIVLAAAAVATLGCGGTPADPTIDGEFVAFARDFEGFSTWDHSSIDNTTPAGSTHVSGKRTVYINHEPAADATTFPVGTVIVKRTELDGKLFARVKRGGNFNPKGAIGWEWFELTEGATGVKVKWRGVGPPKGEMYGGDPNAGCNMCHRLVPDNDYVFSLGLMLGGKVDGAASLDAADAASADDSGADAGVNPEAPSADAAGVDAVGDGGVDGATDSEPDGGTDDASHE